MNLRALTDPGLIQIHAPFSTRDEAIAALAGLLAAQGKLHDHTAFVNEVMQREALGPTALGEGLAVPHGKCAAVREATFAVATLREPVAWQGVEGDEPVQLIFLLAIPAAQAGTTHIQLLTELTTLLVDDAVREAAINAPSAEALLAILEARPLPPPVASGSADQPVVVCVTACPAGIAHTYMAAEYLERAGRRLGITVYTEKQGANGIEGRLTAAQIATAQGVIFAADVAVKDAERFAGRAVLSVPVAAPIKQAESLLRQALAQQSPVTRNPLRRRASVRSGKPRLSRHC